MEVRWELLEIEGPGGDELDVEEQEGGGLTGEISVEEEVGHEIEEEDDQEEGEEEQRSPDEGEEDQLAETVRSWPVLSRYQSTKFQHRILSQGMFDLVCLVSVFLKKLTEILAIHNMRKRLKSKRRKPTGQDLDIHLQVREVLRLQRYGLQKPFWKRTRKAAAAMVAATGGRREPVRNRIIDNEKDWIKIRLIPSSQRGKSPMLHWLIDDEATKLALQENIAGAGERITGQSLAYMISSSGRLEFSPLKSNLSSKIHHLHIRKRSKPNLHKLLKREMTSRIHLAAGRQQNGQWNWDTPIKMSEREFIRMDRNVSMLCNIDSNVSSQP